MLIILLLIAGGIFWWLYSARQGAEKDIQVFARNVAKRVAVDYDQKFLSVSLSLEGRAQLMPSWRDRLFDQLREMGKPVQPIEVEGGPEFSSFFFDPHGIFKAHLKYPASATSAELEFAVSRGMVAWQIDTLSVTWSLPPPTPTPEPIATATPTATPSQKAKRKTR